MTNTFKALIIAAVGATTLAAQTTTAAAIGSDRDQNEASTNLIIHSTVTKATITTFTPTTTPEKSFGSTDFLLRR
jgi:hypothetical protein